MANSTRILTRIVLGLLLAMTSASASADTWSQQRQQLRDTRVEFLASLETNQSQRAAAAETRLRAFLDEIEEAGWRCDAEALWGLVAGVQRMDPARIGDLPDRVRKIIAAAPDGVKKKTDRAFTAALKTARQELTDDTYDLLRRAAKVGEVQAAVELMRQVLTFDPDHKAIRKALGQVRLADKYADRLPDTAQPRRAKAIPELAGYDPDRNWFSPFDAKMLRKGLVWTARSGWMPFDHADRYERGQVFDMQKRRWSTLASANEEHRRPGRDWVIRTEHVEVRGTADLDKMAQVATDLEAIYDEIFSVYAAFFAEGGKHDPLKLALGLVEHKPLVVWVYRTRQEYLDRSGAVEWSGGIFRPDNGTTYFYGGPSTTMYHEFTHQVLHVMTGKNESPSWLTESIAQFTETADMADGELLFLGAPYVGQIALDDLFALRSGAAWSRHVERYNGVCYAEAGSVSTFCMQADEGKYSADFIDFVRDSYRGKTRGRAIWEYLGLSKRDFAESYRAWGEDRGRGERY